jgi:hypothetical protein
MEDLAFRRDEAQSSDQKRNICPGEQDVRRNHRGEVPRVSSRCVDRRIADKQALTAQNAVWERERNANHVNADWHFTAGDARIKLKQLYPLNLGLLARTSAAIPPQHART